MALVPFKPNPTQAKFIYSAEQYTGLYGGVGNGKSAAGATKFLMLMDLFPRNFGLVGRLTYPELRDTIMKDVLDIARTRNGGTLEPGPYIKTWNKSEMRLELQSESVAVFRYLENYESILSLNLGVFYVDQAEFVPEQTYLALESRMRYWGPDERDPMHPEVPTKKEEWAAWYKDKYRQDPPAMPREFGFITGNPGPGWVYERYKRNPSKLYTLFEAPTSENRANLPKGFEDRLRQSYSEDYVRRFVDGDWSVLAGSIYKSYNAKVHVVEPTETSFWKTGGEYGEGKLVIPAYYPRFLGWDHGQQNPTAMEGFAVDEEGNLIFYLEHYKTSSILGDHAKAVKTLCQGEAVPRGDNGTIMVWMDPQVAGTSDPTTGRNFRQLYVDEGIVGLVANKAVNAGIGKVEYLLTPSQTHLYPHWHPKRGQPGSPRLFIIKGYCPALETEFPLYQWERKKSGQDQNERETPRKYMDHAMDASRYAVMAYFDQRAEAPAKARTPTYNQWVLSRMLEDAPTGDGPW